MEIDHLGLRKGPAPESWKPKQKSVLLVHKGCMPQAIQHVKKAREGWHLPPLEDGSFCTVTVKKQLSEMFT